MIAHYCDCGRPIKVKHRKSNGNHWNNWKPSKNHDQCRQCWRAETDRRREYREAA